jgi:hypothetical protein
MININLNINSINIKKFSAEYRTVYNAFTIKPNAAVAAEQNKLVKYLVNSGVWTKLDIFYIFAGHTNTSGESLINWKSPGTFNATAVNSPSFVSLEGFVSDGATSYIDTNWIPSLNGVNYTRNNACIGTYIRANISASEFDFGAIDSSHWVIINTRTGSDEFNIRINSDIGSNASNTDSKGLYVVNRVLSTEQDLYKNKIRVINDSVASSGVPTVKLYALCRNNNGVASNNSTRQQSLLFAGSGFTQANVDDLTNAFEAYMDSNGKGIIS